MVCLLCRSRDAEILACEPGDGEAASEVLRCIGFNARTGTLSLRECKEGIVMLALCGWRFSSLESALFHLARLAILSGRAEEIAAILQCVESTCRKRDMHFCERLERWRKRVIKSLVISAAGVFKEVR